jgi:hypothetical protein
MGAFMISATPDGPAVKHKTMTPRPDGNIAFKVTWVYGKHGPFSSSCTPMGREINVVNDPRVWCSQPDCPCFKILHSKSNKGDYWKHYSKTGPNKWPCYDAAVFTTWRFGAGIYHHGRNKNKPIPVRYWRVGKLAFLTSKESGQPESKRKIIGCFEIARVTQEPYWGNVIYAGALRLRVANFNKAPLYWAFHRQSGPPRWNTGLFRYIPDKEAQAMLAALRKKKKVSGTISADA